MAFTKTDTGTFRATLAAAGISTSVLSWVDIRNDVNRKTGLRQLTVECQNTRMRARALDVYKLNQQLKATFGKRFVSSSFDKHTWHWIFTARLDDKKGAPIGTPRKPPKYPRYKAPVKQPSWEQRREIWAAYIGCDSETVPVFNHHHVLKYAVKAFKKAYSTPYRAPVIVNLIIPAGTLVYISSGKCRAASALVDSIHLAGGCKARESHAISGYTTSFEYVPGATVVPDNGFDMQEYECAAGIHFFLTIQEALSWR
jgi:hypothetical protein